MNTITPQLLNRYLRGECSAAEAGQVLDWLATPEGAQYLADQFQEDFSRLAHEPALLPETPHAAHQLDQIRAEIRGVPKKPDSGLAWRRHWAAVAASITLFLGFLAYWYLTLNHTVRYHTAYGETKEITLPDQSKVILNGNTSLHYQDNWSGDQPREVHLDGEAFFAVVHTRNHQQFIVHTPGSLKVEVLGTRFNVWRRRQKTRVSLNDGSVKLHIESLSAQAPLVMQPGELVELDNRSEQVRRKKVNADAYSSWKSKKLVFDRISLLEITQLLQDTYGLTVTVSDTTLLQQRFSGTVPNENAAILLEVLSGLFNLDVIRHGKQVHLKAK